MRAHIVPLVLVAAVMLIGTRGHARPAAPASQAATAPASQPPAAPAVPPAALRPLSRDQLAIDLRVDVPVTGALGVAALTLTLTESKLGPHQCRWCEPRLNALDSAGRDARWKGHEKAADWMADATAYVVGPGIAFGLVSWAAAKEGGLRQVTVDDLVILEAMAITAATVSGVKYAAARRRPYVRDRAAGSATGGDDNLSFPSGHTSLAFSIATASGTVATLRGYRVAPWVWGAGMTVAAFTGYLRLAADKHYASDAIVGAAIGSLVGWAVPYLHHKLRKRR